MTHRPRITAPLCPAHHLHPVLRSRVADHGGRVAYHGDAIVLEGCAVYPVPVPLVWDAAMRWYVIAAPPQGA